MSQTSAASSPPAIDPPGPSAPSATFHFTSRDGRNLYGEWFTPESPRAAAVVVHGYFEHCGRYRELAHVLVNAGLAVLTYDMRGHGRADGQRGFVASFDEYLDDLDAAWAELDRLLTETGTKQPLPRLLVGHSNGGLIALRALADRPRRPAPLTAAVLSSPFIGFKVKVSPVIALVGKVAGRWLPTLSLPSELALDQLTSDPDKQRERQLDTLCNDVASAGWFQAVQKTQAYVLEHASAIDLPTLWLVGGEDQIADPAATRVLSARLGTEPAYHDLSGLQHEIFNERERGRVFGMLTGFVDQVIGQVIGQVPGKS